MGVIIPPPVFLISRVRLCCREEDDNSHSQIDMLPVQRVINSVVFNFCSLVSLIFLRDLIFFFFLGLSMIYTYT